MEDDLNVRIGKKVLDLRIKRQLTTVQLAHKVGVSQAQISRLENGKQGFRTSTLNRIALALDVPPAYFITDQEESVAVALQNPAFRERVREAAERFLRGEDAAIVVPGQPAGAAAS